MSPLRLAFAGTPDFACPSLAALRGAGHQVVLVITQPDRPCGRGQRLAPPPVKLTAECLGLPLLQPERIDTPDLRRLLEGAAMDAMVVVAYGQKIPPWLLALPPLGCLNVHASLLPRYRGAAPIQRAIMNGDRETGVTIIRLDEGWDTGAILCQRSARIGPDENAGSLHDRLAGLGADLLIEALTGLATGAIAPVAQGNALATKAPRIRPEEVRLDWREPALKLHNLVRALAPAPLAETFHGERRLQIVRTSTGEPGGSAIPGTVTEVGPEGVSIQTGVGTLSLVEIKPANRHPMPAADYARGHQLIQGVQLT